MRVMPLLLCVAILAVPVAGADSKPSTATTSPSPATRPAVKAPATAPSTSPAPAATQPAPAGTTGAVAVQAVQGTKGGPEIAGAPVTLEMVFQQGSPLVKHMKLDEHGGAVFENLPVSQSFQPRITVEYGGTVFQSVGQEMDMALPAQRIKVDVYETTETEPAWQILVRHIIIRPTPHGPLLDEVLVVENPTDRAWLGTPGPDGRRQTVAISLPTGAEGVQYAGGFAEGTTHPTTDGIASTAPLMPGKMKYRVVYLLRTEDGNVKVALRAPVAVQTTLVLVPGTGVGVAGTGLKDGGTVNMGPQKMHTYRLPPMARGESVTLALTGAKSAMGEHEHDLEDKPSSLPKMIALVGGGTVLVIAAFVLMFRPRKPKPAEKADGS